VLYDFTFDAPKSVTLAYELGGDERIEGAFREAVEETMGEMEDAMRVRVRKDGARADRETGNMIWGEFIHKTSRPVTGDDGVPLPDPQLHCHAVAINATYDAAEDRWKAGEFERLVRDKGFYQAAFHSRLAEKLAHLGYGIERDGTSFRLAAIDRATSEAFSRRGAIIKAEAERLGTTTPEAKRILARRTREAKPDIPMSMAELRREWNKRLSDDERTAIMGARAGQQTATLDADGAVDYAMSHCFERASTVTETKFMQTALAQSYGKASVADVRRAAMRDGVLRKERNGQRFVTTHDVLKEEIDMTNYVRDGRARRRRFGGDGPIELEPKLTPEQRDAALMILNSRDKVTGLRGRAGTGKTTMMRATVASIEKTGKQVFAFAPSAEASRGVLRAEGFENAETVERLLIDPEMQRQINGQVLLIDEAGLLSVKDMKRLFDVAEAQNARVILAGDTGQHNAVARGDALRILEKNAGLQCATLEQIRRQTNDEYRQAVAAIAEGDAMGKGGKTRLEEGLEAFDRMGAIIETPGEECYRQIAEDYADLVSQRKKNGELKTSLVIAPTHAEIRHVTGAIRDMLKARGQLSGNEMEYTALHPCNLTEAERTDYAQYMPGEIVQFHQNAKGFKRGERVRVKSAGIAGVRIARADGSETILPFSEAKKFQVYRSEKLMLAEKDKVRFTMNGFTRETRRGGKLARSRVNNGSIGEVKRLLKNGDIELTNGFIIPKDYGGLDYGYVVTSHASQGKTVDVPLVALGHESFAAANREQLYVSLSRGREAVRLYTDDKAAMLDAVQGSTARLSATELMEEEAQTPERKAAARDRLYRHVRRAFQRRRERNAARDFIAAHDHYQQRKGHGHER
jgi:conjugative relaxase-like TrwC/TraI family protein